jgi:hypothetical protein
VRCVCRAASTLAGGDDDTDPPQPVAAPRATINTARGARSLS